jgi:oligopeptide/dipeptide ABC transporter ATP-binding protein
MSLLSVDNLSVSYPYAPEPVVQSLDFSLDRGESLGIVGESGSGKTQTALAIMGLLPANAVVTGKVMFDQTDLLGAPPGVLNTIRARRIAMVFQDPMTALNPYVRIGKQLTRILFEHRLCEPREANARVMTMLEKVGLPDAERQFRSYPHEMSGGMRQRVMIAASLLGDPDVLIADEPTTALDVTIQAQILHLLKQLRGELNSALLLITHDLGVVAGNCERMLVMDEGRLLEEGKTRAVFSTPTSQKMRELLAAAPNIRTSGAKQLASPSGDAVLEIEDLSVSFRERRERGGERLHAVRPISLALGKGETLAVVGESGSGKTSLARAVVGLIPPDSGNVVFLGERLATTVNHRSPESHREIQMVFQDPLASLNPAMRVSEIVAEPLLIHDADADDRQAKVRTTLEQVGIGEHLLNRYPHELSGGQAQRVAIARSLVLKPTVIVCDEAVAALDATVQNEIIELLQSEQERSGLSLIFIAHDLAVVRQISHRVLVMYMGRLCEFAESEGIFSRPRHPYTKALLNAVPQTDPAAKPVDVLLAGEVSSILNPPAGCPFHPRCQQAIATCSETLPEVADCDGSLVACHRAAELDLSY